MHALILAGGNGERIRSIFPTTPKPLIKFNGIPFLKILIDSIRYYDLKNIHVSINSKESSLYDKYKLLFNINLIKEDLKLDTGGAVKYAFNRIGANNLLVLNGDTLCPLNLEKLIKFHFKKESDITIGIVKNNEKRMDGGNIIIDRENNVVQFSEKKLFSDDSYISTGIYIINKKFLQIAEKAFSLEKFIQENINQKVFAYIADEPIYDYGTPERYDQYKSIISKYSKSF